MRQLDTMGGRQVHRPGEAMQTDFTSADELGITIAGEVSPLTLRLD